MDGRRVSFNSPLLQIDCVLYEGQKEDCANRAEGRRSFFPSLLAIKSTSTVKSCFAAEQISEESTRSPAKLWNFESGFRKKGAIFLSHQL